MTTTGLSFNSSFASASEKATTGSADFGSSWTTGNSYSDSVALTAFFSDSSSSNPISVFYTDNFFEVAVLDGCFSDSESVFSLNVCSLLVLLGLLLLELSSSYSSRAAILSLKLFHSLWMSSSKLFWETSIVHYVMATIYFFIYSTCLWTKSVFFSYMNLLSSFSFMASSICFTLFMLSDNWIALVRSLYSS